MDVDDATFEYDIDNDYFTAVEAEDVKGGALHAFLEVRKIHGIFELSLEVEGNVIVSCDRCLGDMCLAVSNTEKMLARLGDTYSEDDDMVTIPEDDGTLNVFWFIYETIALAIPTRHVHEEGQCDPGMMSKLEELSVETNGDEDHDVDPRWSELEKIKSTFKE